MPSHLRTVSKFVTRTAVYISGAVVHLSLAMLSHASS